jgi:nitrate/nitrite transporter NarK
MRLPVIKLTGRFLNLGGSLIEVLSVIVVIEDVVYLIFNVAHSLETVAIIGLLVISAGSFFASSAGSIER